MLFTTTTQYIALAVALVAGWLFGLASHPGGKRWKQRYHDERDAHAGVRKDYEGKLTAATTRIKELERENERLVRATPVAAAAPVAAIAPTPASIPAVVPVTRSQSQSSGYVSGTSRPTTGWFDWKNRARTDV